VLNKSVEENFRHPKMVFTPRPMSPDVRNIKVVEKKNVLVSYSPPRSPPR
jgi:hypothetical protein